MIIIASTNNSLNDFVPSDYCDQNNTICIDAITNIINYLDGSNDPCDDYYLHVCKRWESGKRVPPRFFKWDQYNELSKKVYREIISDFQVGIEHNSSVIRKMANFYQSCLSRSNGTYYYPETITSFLTTIGGWPLIGQSISEDYDWMEAMAKLFRNTDVENSFFLMGNFDYNSTNSYLLLEQTVKSLIWFPSDLNDESDYVNYIKKIISNINPQYLQNEEILREIETTATFCRRHMEILSDVTETEEHQIISIGELKSKTQLDFKKLVQFILKDIMIVTDNTKIMVRHIEYFIRLRELMFDYINQMRIIANYIGLVAAKQLQSDIQNRNHASSRKLYCQQRTFFYMPYAAGYLLANNTDRIAVMRDVALMTKEIKEVLETDVNQTSWISANSKASFINKLKKLKFFAIGPYWMTNINSVERYYRTIGDITSNNYMQNLIKLEKFRKFERFKIYSRQRHVDDGWRYVIFHPTPYYDKYLNALYIPVMSLKPPFYHVSYNEAMKFGSLGVRIAEGIMSAFDSENMYYDESGKNKTAIWKEDIEPVIYHDYIYCLINSIDNFTTPLMPYQIDVSRHKNTIFADTMGMIQAYKAFKRITARDNLIYYGPEQIKINYLKLFFMNYGFMKCEKITEVAPTLILLNVFTFLTEKHSLIGSIANSRDFFQLHQCYLFPNSEVFGKGKVRCNFWREVPSK